MGMQFSLPLYLVFGFLVIVAAWDTLGEHKLPQAVVSALMGIPLVLLATFRVAGVGNDDLAYLKMLHEIPSVLECSNVYCDYSYTTFNIEFGFFMLLSMLAALARNSYILFGVSSLAAVGLNVRSIRYFSPYFALGVLVYFTHFYLAKDLNAIRLGIASGLVFLAATYLHKKEYMMLALYLALAMAVHVSSVLFIIPVVLYLLKPTRALYLSLSVVFILLASFIDSKWLLGQMAFISFISEKIDSYLTTEKYGYALPLFDMVNVKNLLLVTIGWVWSKKLELRYPTFNLVFCVFYCATFLRIVMGDFAILAGRGYASISMFEYALLPMIAVHLLGKNIGFVIFALYAFGTLYLNLNSNLGWTGGSEVFFDFQ
ncbi:EpsG family protein [Pseudomonas costantinii]|uniref:EpsG family protein n=1 Tax=Pseudomonas costantinii TaxID=168469 RepID=UPI0015A38971|nr:EpsG family protein [Pseudomonas costantinii]NVZ68392.1 EpsG family protein [Pseudomonas costantinii]